MTIGQPPEDRPDKSPFNVSVGGTVPARALGKH
jgi:hypothetical protein